MSKSINFNVFILFITSVLHLIHSVSSQSYYSIVAPDIIRPNSDYHVSVTLHDSSSPCQMRVGIESRKSKYENFRDITIQPLTSQLIRFSTGSLEPGQYRLNAEGLSGLDFHNEQPINFLSKNVSIFVQTDKALYKANDLIQFRVLILDINMKPISSQELVHIQIEDGAKNRIREWRNLRPNRGVISDELMLSSYPVLGDWHIIVEAMKEFKEHKFEVAEHILPKFDVEIDTPIHQYYRQGKIRATIRTKYKYGKPVKGEVTVSIYPKTYGSFQPLISNLITRKVMKIDGKASVEFDIDNELNFKEDYEQGAVMEAIVEEELSGRKQNVTTGIYLHKSKYKILLTGAASSYKPGLPYTVMASVQRFDGLPVVDSTDEIIVKQAISYYDDENIENVTETRHAVDSQGLLYYDLVVPHSKGFTLKFIYLDAEEKLGWIPAVHSHSQVYLKATLKTEKPRINKDVVVEVQSTENMRYLSYQVLGRGDVIITNTVQIPNRKSHSITFLASFVMVPEAQFIAYFVRDGQIVSDKIEINFDELQNFVELDVSTNRASADQEVDITVISKPNSYVGLMGIDQRVLMLKKGNDLDKDRVFSELRHYENHKLTPEKYGTPNEWEDFTSSGSVLLTNAKPLDYYTPTSTIPPYENEIMYGNGVTTVKKTDVGPAHVLRTNTRPPLAGPYAFSRIPKPYWSRSRIHTMHEISDTWLFVNFSSGYEGRHTIHKKLPESITSWIISGFSLDPINGLGLTKESKRVQVFQPFIISLDLPFSVKRGEIISIPVAVFNNLDEDLEVEVTLHNTDQELEFVKMENEVESPRIQLYKRKTIRVGSNEGAATSFMVKPKKLGQVAIKATARSSRAGDGVEKILKVEPEGVTIYESSSILIDLRDTASFSGNMSVQLPKNFVSDSVHVEITAVGDLLGGTIKNMNSLIRMPMGCGEQNMLSFVPNIVILDYLKSTNQLTQAIESKAKRLLEFGYQRELSYKHGDGSYSAFGKTDEIGSTWLTAFVVRSFIQARKYIQIDPKTIDDALDWLSRIQAPNGSFPEVGRIISTDMQSQSGKGIALTAYALVSFLEDKSRVGAYQNSVNKAIDYIVRNLEGNDDLYALAVSSYALQLANYNSKNYILQTFDSRSKRKDGKQWWEKPVPPTDFRNVWYTKPNSINIEITSYGLLALLEAGLYGDALPIVKWLVNQRNELGGFQTTQDTFVGLQALSKFAERVSTNFNDVQITIKYNQGAESRISVNRGNSLIQQAYELPDNVQHVNISATGRGIALLQLSYKYNVNVTGAWPRFTLDPQPNRNSHSDYLHLTVCTSFVAAGSVNRSNMAVMEVQFPSGFTADLDTLPSLEISENVRKVETKNDDTTVVVYFDHLTRKEVCPTLDAFRTQKVAIQVPAAVTLYDYYDNSRRARQFYRMHETTLCDICEGSDCSETCQVRASERRSPKSAFDDEEEGRVMETSSTNEISVISVTLIIIASTFTIYL